MFTTIVLTKELDIKPFLFSLAKNIKKINDKEEDGYDDDDNDDDNDFLDEENLIILNVEDITNKDTK
jgi:hypothetical protein